MITQRVDTKIFTPAMTTIWILNYVLINVVKFDLK